MQRSTNTLRQYTKQLKENLEKYLLKPSLMCGKEDSKACPNLIDFQNKLTTIYIYIYIHMIMTVLRND